MTPLYNEFVEAAYESSSSGHGISYLRRAARCGKLAILADERDKAWAIMRDGLSPEARLAQLEERVKVMSTQRNALIAGAAYHKLHEWWRQAANSTSPTLKVFFVRELEALEAACLEDVNLSDALKWFRGYIQSWPHDFWGTCIATEMMIPESPGSELESVIMGLLGEPLTAKPDMVVEIRESDLARVRTRCPSIQEAGIYLVDHKTAASPYGSEYYTEDMQALWYPKAYELATGQQCKGTIFDVVLKPRWNAKSVTWNADSFEAHFAPHNPGRLELLAGIIMQAQANVNRALEHNIGNKGECMHIAFGKLEKCAFMGNGCRGG